MFPDIDCFDWRRWISVAVAGMVVGWQVTAISAYGGSVDRKENAMNKINVSELKAAVAAELAQRKVPGGWAQKRGGEAELYGATGVTTSMSIVGLPIDAAMREELIRTILSCQRADGSFEEGKEAGHALCKGVQSLNLLGAQIPENVGPLAPKEPAKLKGWMDSLNWNSTHKELWGHTAPLLASGAVSNEWVRVYQDNIAARLSPERPLETWCKADNKPWRVISATFHVLQGFDAGGLPYPKPEMMLERLLTVDWPTIRQTSHQTKCTDADWAWVLSQLGYQLPGSLERSLPKIRAVAEQRAREWNEGKVKLAGMTTHDISCFLWSTATYQKVARDFFEGPYLHDTTNDPALFRLGR